MVYKDLILLCTMLSRFIHLSY